MVYRVHRVAWLFQLEKRIEAAYLFGKLPVSKGVATLSAHFVENTGTAINCHRPFDTLRQATYDKARQPN